MIDAPAQDQPQVAVTSGAAEDTRSTAATEVSALTGSAGGCWGAPWPDNPPGRRRVDCEQVRRADGAPDELAAAVRADAVQDVLRAVAAPGALVRADEHVRGRRVEVPVAAFTIRPQLQHMTSIDRQRVRNKRPCAQPGSSTLWREAHRVAPEGRLGAS